MTAIVTRTDYKSLEFPLVLLMTVNSFLMNLFCRKEINSATIQTAIKMDSAGIYMSLCN